jgi:hypothetical protein
MRMPKVMNIIKAFKDMCQGRGWKTSEREDWIGIGDVYHNFLYVRDIHPSSFKRIVSNHKCVVPEGLSYHVVDVSYTAWLFPKAPSASVMRTIMENPDFAKRVAVYDLGPMLEGKNECARLNDTNSPAFQEFENFLSEKWNVKFETLSLPVMHKNNVTIAQLA